MKIDGFSSGIKWPKRKILASL